MIRSGWLGMIRKIYVRPSNIGKYQNSDTS